MKNLTFAFSLLLLTLAASGQNAVVSPTLMNVLYTGIPNPVEIAVPGIASDKVTATVNNGTINRTAAGWEILPQKMDFCVVSVYANNKKVADKTFRVKSLPRPVAVFAGAYSGSVSREKAKIAFLEARIMDFEWDIEYKIESFTMSFNGAELYAKGGSLTEQMRSRVSGLTHGQSIIFKDIRATGPDKKTINLDPITVKME